MVVVHEQAPAPLPAPPRPFPRLHRRSVVVAAVIALLVVSAVWWEFNPGKLSYGGYEVGYDRGQLGRAAYFDAGVKGGSQSHRTIDVRNVRPLIVTNTAAASVGVLLCHNLPTESNQLGVATDLKSSCASVTAFRPGPLALNGLGVSVVLVVTPNARGTVRIAGVDGAYRDGIRRGHQHAGGSVVVNVP